MDIILVGLYLLSCLQKIHWLTKCERKRVVVTYEKGIFYSAVLARSGTFLLGESHESLQFFRSP